MFEEKVKASFLIEKLEEFGISFYKKNRKIADFDLLDIADSIAVELKKLFNSEETIDFNKYLEAVKKTFNDDNKNTVYYKKLETISAVVFSPKFASAVYDSCLVN